MAKYNLQPNESIIMKQERVLHGGRMATFTDELILTNINLVLISKGLLGNSKGIQIIPLKQIKVFNGKAQVLIGKTSGGFPQLDVYYSSGQDSFGFESKKEAIKWMDNINKLVTGKSIVVDASPGMAIPGSEYIAETLKGTIDTFKGAFGLKQKNSTELPSKVAKKCSSCGAPISGTKGEIIRCLYCDADQQL